MNIEQLAEKIENYKPYQSGLYVVLQLTENDEDYCLIIKKSNDYVIIGVATWGEYDGFAFHEPEVFPDVVSALESKRNDIEEALFEMELVDEEEEVEYCFNTIYSMGQHVRIFEKHN